MLIKRPRELEPIQPLLKILQNHLLNILKWRKNQVEKFPELIRWEKRYLIACEHSLATKRHNPQYREKLISDIALMKERLKTPASSPSEEEVYDPATAYTWKEVLQDGTKLETYICQNNFNWLFEHGVFWEFRPYLPPDKIREQYDKDIKKISDGADLSSIADPHHGMDPFGFDNHKFH